jgi:SAM-dependent methyltransferase
MTSFCWPAHLLCVATPDSLLDAQLLPDAFDRPTLDAFGKPLRLCPTLRSPASAIAACQGQCSIERQTVDVFLRDYSRRLVEVAGIKPGNRVLDVACGTGVVIRLVANKIGSAGQVVGFDLNAGMLARTRASRETAAAIEWRLGSATDMPFADATFDCVICQHGLQFIPDTSYDKSLLPRDFGASKFESNARPFDTHR